jgi:hypothetical protein
LEYQMIGAQLKKIMIPVCDCLVTLQWHLHGQHPQMLSSSQASL